MNYEYLKYQLNVLDLTQLLDLKGTLGYHRTSHLMFNKNLKTQKKRLFSGDSCQTSQVKHELPQVSKATQISWSD